MNGPNLFLVAAPRSASTQLARWLGSHPDIGFAPVKEPNFFARADFDPDDVARRHLNDVDPERPVTRQAQFAVFRSEARYRALFAGLSTPWRAEASTTYLASETAPGEIREFFPEADLKNWRLETAGQRVQIIKKHEEKGGVLQFGTEIVAAEDGSIAALLGASPGASCSVSVMLDVITQCFPKKLDSWNEKLTQMVPGFSKNMKEDVMAYRGIRKSANEALGI